MGSMASISAINVSPVSLTLEISISPVSLTPVLRETDSRKNWKPKSHGTVSFKRFTYLGASSPLVFTFLAFLVHYVHTLHTFLNFLETLSQSFLYSYTLFPSSFHSWKHFHPLSIPGSLHSWKLFLNPPYIPRNSFLPPSIPGNSLPPPSIPRNSLPFLLLPFQETLFLLFSMQESLSSSIHPLIHLWTIQLNVLPVLTKSVWQSYRKFFIPHSLPPSPPPHPSFFRLIVGCYFPRGDTLKYHHLF